MGTLYYGDNLDILSEVMQGFRTFLGQNDMMAYLAMMPATSSYWIERGARKK